MPHAPPEPLSQDFLLTKFPKWTLAHWCVTVAAASFLILAALPEGRLVDLAVPFGAEVMRVVRSLAAHGTFADPFSSINTGVTAHVAPAYPFLYSLILRAFGTGHTALQIAWACNVFFFALQMGLLPMLSHRLNLGTLPGIVAAALGTFSLYSPIDTRWECFFAGLLFLLALLATEASISRSNWKATWGAGALWGIAILANPIFALLLLAYPLCWILAKPRPDRPSSMRRFAVIAACALVVVTPWIARNYVRFGTFIFVRDNLGLELQTSNNPCATPSILGNIHSGCHFRTHPDVSATVAAQFVAAGEVRFNHTKLLEAESWIAAHPSAFLALTLRRFRLFWFPDLYRPTEAVVVYLITLLSLPGLWMLARKNLVAALLIASTWLLFPLIYYAIQFEPRYRIPIYWTSLLPAAYALVELSRRLPLFKPSSSRISPSA
jgi:hypothetical protein